MLAELAVLLAHMSMRSLSFGIGRIELCCCFEWVFHCFVFSSSKVSQKVKSERQCEKSEKCAEQSRKGQLCGANVMLAEAHSAKMSLRSLTFFIGRI